MNDWISPLKITPSTPVHYSTVIQDMYKQNTQVSVHNEDACAPRVCKIVGPCPRQPQGQPAALGRLSGSRLGGRASKIVFLSCRAEGGGSPQLYYHDCSGRIPGHTTRAPPVGFELETNCFQYYVIANFESSTRHHCTKLVSSLQNMTNYTQCFFDRSIWSHGFVIQANCTGNEWVHHMI